MRIRIISCALAAALFFTPMIPAGHASEINVSWTGGFGDTDWGNAHNWNPLVAPDNGNGTSYAVTLPSPGKQIDFGLYAPFSLGIDSLNSGQSTLNIRPQSYLQTSVLSGAGTIVALNGGGLGLTNASAFTGTIGLDSQGQLTTLSLGNGAVLNGQIELVGSTTGNAVNAIQGYSGTETATNNGMIIGQNGSVGNLALLTNNGTIGTTAVNGRVGSFEVAAYRFDNTNGQLYVDPTTQLQIASPHFANYDGATLTGGTYNLHGELVLNGPSLTGLGTGTVLNVYNGGGIASASANLLSQVSFNQGALSFHETGTNVELTSNGFTNAGSLNVDTGAVLSAGSVYNTGSGTLTVGANSTIYGSGLFNNGQLSISGTLDARGGTANSFLNLDPGTETLSGGTYTLSSTGTLKYDSGTGAHGGDIVNIASGTTLSLARGGQIQVGLTSYDALAQLTSNNGILMLTGGDHSFAPTTGTLSIGNGVFSLTNGATARVYGDLANSGGTTIANGSLAANNGSNSNGLRVGSASEGGSSYATFFGDLHNYSGGDIAVGGGSPYTDVLSAQNITNNGGLVSIAAQGTVEANGTYTQTGQGAVTALFGGSLKASETDVQQGLAYGYGEIDGNVDNSDGQIAPYRGNLEITGDYTQEVDGTLQEGVGDSVYLLVDGNVDLSGVFQGFNDTNATYYAGETFEVLHFGGMLTGDFSSLLLPTLPAGLHFTEEIGAHDIQLEVDTVSPTATPEPSFFWLGGAIISAIAISRRRRSV